MGNAGKFFQNERNLPVNRHFSRKLGLIVLVMLVAEIGALQSAWGGFQKGVAAQRGNDYATALKEYRPLAEQGHLGSQLKMGLYYERGYGVPKDDKEAVRWYRMAAEQGDSQARLKLGWMYESGHGVPQSNVEAVRWYRMVAEQGIPKAQLTMGIMYENGRGVPKDYKEAARWYRIAMENGYPAAQSHVSRMELLIIIQEREELEEKLREERSRRLVEEKLEELREERSRRLVEEKLEELREERSRRLIHKAYQGDPEAQYLLAESYYFGVGVLIGEGIQVDDREAAKWYYKAAEQGHEKAQFNIGQMYRYGLGVPKNDKEAVRWYRMAAEQGHLLAQHHLGWSYVKGKGVPRNYIRAYLWLNLVAKKGNVDAVKMLDGIKSKMTAQQIKEAQRLAKKPQAIKRNKYYLSD